MYFKDIGGRCGEKDSFKTEQIPMWCRPMPPSDEGGAERKRGGGREKVRIPLVYPVKLQFFIISPPVSFADSPLVRGGRVRCGDT